MAANYSTPAQGTVHPANPFNAEQDSEILRKAMKGLGTDEKAIIDILAYRSNEQRQALKIQYKSMFGRDLVDDLKSELGGKFEDVVVALMRPSAHLDAAEINSSLSDLIADLKSELSGHFEDVVVAIMAPPAQFDASQLHSAMKGLGTDEDTLVEIMCTRNNKQLLDIKDAYKTLYKKNLEKELTGDTSGDFKKLMVSLSTGARPENQAVDTQRATADAQALYKAGAGKLGTDEAKFNQILCSLSYPQLQATFQAYAKVSGHSMEKAIESEFSGDIKAGLLAIVKVAGNPAGYFAEKLYKSMKGAGTNDKALIRLVVSRSEIDMVQIKQEFQKMYKKTLESFITDDCSGDYKKILLALVK